jgi:DNA (cytosine-5)-methyltransferase 1
MNYYNEWDKPTANWLRELIKRKLLPEGYVDERSITEVTASDLEGFTQCHFFAGIGGWSRALQLCRIPSTVKLWTGSPPCQPFSQAGSQRGKFDERHLAPTFLKLIDQCKPPIVFGEQVAKAVEDGWLDDLHVEFEKQGYAIGTSILSGGIVGAPHKRERLFFGAIRSVVDSNRHEYWSKVFRGNGKAYGTEIIDWKEIFESWKSMGTGSNVLGSWDSGRPNLCRDGKFRIIEPSIPLLVNGISSGMGRLRGFGNAIIPPLAASFIQDFLISCDENIKGG